MERIHLRGGDYKKQILLDCPRTLSPLCSRCSLALLATLYRLSLLGGPSKTLRHRRRNSTCTKLVGSGSTSAQTLPALQLCRSLLRSSTILIQAAEIVPHNRQMLSQIQRTNRWLE